MYSNRYLYRGQLRIRRRVRLWNWSMLTWLIVSGSLNGILIGAILVNWFWPNHQIYLDIRAFVQSLFGAH
jgi:NhaP-type Na+/H+ or K+/H+ antiporter